MRRSSFRDELFVFLALLLLSSAQPTRQDAASQFFDRMDSNNDGQIDEREAGEWIRSALGGAEFSTKQEVDAAVKQMRVNLDGSDAISEGELQDHLEKLQEGSSVIEWVQHGLRLPQYVDAFQENAITAQDFPLLVMDEGASLENDLNVKSRLHRAQILRSLNRLILGIGRPPGVPEGLYCTVDANCGKVFLEWAAPGDRGDPPVHKYVIERSALGHAHHHMKPHWVPVAEAKDIGASRRHSADFPALVGKQQFRVVAWNAYGHGPYAIVENCTKAIGTESDFCPVEFGGHQTEVVPRFAGTEQLVGEVKPTGVSRKDNQMLMGSVVMVLVTFAIRFLQSRHITFMQCLAYCKIWKLGRVLGLAGMQRWACHKKQAIQNSGDEVCSSRQQLEAHDVGTGLSAFQSKAGMPSKIRKWNLPGSHKHEHLPPQLRTQSEGIDSDAIDMTCLDSGEYTHNLWDDKSMVFSGFTTDDINWGMPGERDQQPWPDLNSTPLELEQEESGPTNGRCAYGGCTRRWCGVRGLRNRLQSHYCGICNLMYCHHHTRISPHGVYGHCGQQSQCVCMHCFELLSQKQQEALENTNKLKRSPSRSERLSKMGSRDDASASGKSTGSSSRDDRSGGLLNRSNRKLDRAAMGPKKGSRVGSVLKSLTRRSVSSEDWEEPEDPERDLRWLYAHHNWVKAIRRVQCVCSLQEAGREGALRRSSCNGAGQDAT